MSEKRLRIFKGADKSFLVRIKSNKTEDPYSLDGVTHLQVVFMNADRTKLVLTNDVRPATTASVLLNNTTFVAQNAGAIGNSIFLEFDGIKTIAQVVDDWNTANPMNMVNHNASDDSLVFPHTQVRLNGGRDSYTPVMVYGEPKLGKINVTLSETETAKLRSGSDNSFSVIIDKGLDVGGSRIIGTFEQKVDIKDSLL